MDETNGRHVTYGFIAKAAMVAIAVWALAQGLWLVRDILFIGFAGILLAVLFSLLVDRLEGVIPRPVAAAVTLTLFLALVAGFWALVWPQLQEQVDTVMQNVPNTLGGAVDRVQDWWSQVVPVGGQAGAQADANMQERLRTEAMNMVAGALPLLNTAVGALSGLVLIVFAGVFLVVAPGSYVESMLRLVPGRGRDRLRDALYDAGVTLKRWIAGMSVSMAIIFVTTTAGLYLLGVPAALVLGLIAGFLVFIPFIGPLLSAIPAIAMGLTVSPTMALWVALLYLGVQLLESNLIIPIVMKEAVELQPAAILLFQMAMGVLFGFLGLFLAVPLFAVIRTLALRLYIEPMERSGDRVGHRPSSQQPAG